jgi:protein SCO1/2
VPFPVHRLRTAIAAALVSAAGIMLAHAATDGFQAYTLESARRLAALRSPSAVPDLSLELLDSGRARLSAVSGEVLLVDFIYTRCPTYCSVLGSVYAQLKERLASEIAAGQVKLVSISFDPEHDGPVELRAYRNRYTREPAGWLLGRPPHARDVRQWLDAFGVVVIPDEFGGYAHNAAVHIVGPGRRLVAIHDLNQVEAIVNRVHDILGRTGAYVAAR